MLKSIKNIVLGGRIALICESITKEEIDKLLRRYIILDLYITQDNSTKLIENITEYNDATAKSMIFNFPISEIFSPLDYNAVILKFNELKYQNIVTLCKNLSTPVFRL